MNSKKYHVSFSLSFSGNPKFFDSLISPENKLLKENSIISYIEEGKIKYIFSGNIKLSSLRITVDDMIKSATIGINIKKEINRIQ